MKQGDLFIVTQIPKNRYRSNYMGYIIEYWEDSEYYHNHFKGRIYNQNYQGSGYFGNWNKKTLKLESDEVYLTSLSPAIRILYGL